MENQAQTTVKAAPKYLEQQAARTTFTFGPVWNAAVLGGKVKDFDKLVAHAAKLQCGKKSDLRRTKFDTVLVKVQKVLAQQALSNA
ncbi:hypothetical protein [Acinetobacter sp.]|uniref:hypothetical protein n=1 Tax=Acinetobacter sp. TaxID=472 RepID=UPI00388FCF94